MHTYQLVLETKAGLPNIKSTREAIDFILKSTEKAGYSPGSDIFLALDCASTEYYNDNKYIFKGEEES